MRDEYLEIFLICEEGKHFDLSNERFANQLFHMLLISPKIKWIAALKFVRCTETYFNIYAKRWNSTTEKDVQHICEFYLIMTALKMSDICQKPFWCQVIYYSVLKGILQIFTKNIWHKFLSSSHSLQTLLLIGSH